MSDVLQSTARLTRNIAIKKHFENTDQPFEPKSKSFCLPSTWTPKPAPSTAELLFQIDSCVVHCIRKHRTKPQSIFLHQEKNLSPGELQALHTLKNNKAIVIKPADKGGSVVVMDKTAYLTECYRQLEDTNYYQPLTQPTFSKNVGPLNNILNDMYRNRYISFKQLEFLMAPRDAKSRNFYILPKIHKDNNTWYQPDRMPPGRPIISDCGSESYHISSYIDYHLNPLCSRHASFLKDTYDLLNKVKQIKMPSDCILMSADVTSLYTNMHLNRTLACARLILNKYPDASRPDSALLGLLEIILKNNDFAFDNKFFVQTTGIAMGKKFAPALANIYLIDLDNKITRGFELIKPLFYFRYLDDIIMAWPGTLDQLLRFVTILNAHIPGIKLTITHNPQSIEFLDVTFHKRSIGSNLCVLDTRPFFKSTGSHQLLHCISFHPPHMSPGVLKSQIIRFKRLSSSYFDYSQACSVLFDALKHRGYSLKRMKQTKALLWAQPPREIGIDPNKVQTNAILPMIYSYNIFNTMLISKLKRIIQNSNLLPNCRLIASFTNNKNLQQHLVHSKLR